MATLYSVDTRRHPHEGPPAQLPLHRHDGPDFISASQTKHEAPRTQWTTLLTWAKYKDSSVLSILLCIMRLLAYSGTPL